MLGSLLSASAAHAQVQTFFVDVPEVSEQHDVMEVCRDRFTAALVRVGGFAANQDAITQQSVTDCLGETASATAKRECEVSMANIAVDFLILPTVRRLGTSWNWTLKALIPAQAARQVWGGDELSNEADSARAAYATCDNLARDFACSQGVAQACVGSGFGAGPILGTEAAAPPQGSGPARAQPARARMSALDVMEPTPQVVSVWIDGKDAGTSENQITGVPQGRHEVALKAPGYFDHVEQLTFAAGLPTVLKQVRLRKTTATLRVEMVERVVATVFIGGRERGTTANPLAGIAPGEVEVVLRAEGYRERRERVTLEADKETVLKSSRLDALPATLTVTANILGAEIVVDGAVVGTTTGEADAFEVAPTAKQLEVLRSGYAPFEQRLSLRAGGTAEVSVNLTRVQIAEAKLAYESAMEKFKKWDSIQLGETVPQQQKALDARKTGIVELQSSFESVTEFNSADVTACAFFMRGRVYQRMADILYQTPIPEALADDPFAEEKYIAAIEGSASQYEGAAVKEWEIAYPIMQKIGVVNTCTIDTTRQLNRYRGSEYPILSEPIAPFVTDLVSPQIFLPTPSTPVVKVGEASP